MDLQNDPAFQELDVAFVSIAFDSPAEQAAVIPQYGITNVPLASDSDGSVSESYEVLQWKVASGEPGHTFVLVNPAGEIAWIRDYGAPQNGGVMYVDPQELVDAIQTRLEG